jgi:hypothetical protein
MNSKQLFVGFLAACACFALPAFGAASEKPAYVETFDGEAPATMLNGTIEVGPSKSWATDIANGKLVFTNPKGVDAVRYISVPWIIFPNERVPQRTDDMNISAIVTAESQDRSGAGIMAGNARPNGDYLIFSVGENNLYRVLQKASGKVTILVVGSNPAIKPRQPNLLELQRVKDRFSFKVNGETIVEVPYQKLETAPVGIAAFGIGRFEFDEVRITREGRSGDDETMKEPGQPRRP